MHAQASARQRRATRKVSGTLLMLALLMFLSLAAASPALHAVICPDADQPTHQCAITKFAAGKVEAPAGPVLCPAVDPPAFSLPAWPGEAPPAVPLFRLSPCRAPPFPFQVRAL